mmetsp:Transcript_70903/g.208059  ORF Transcript_70903/g.208059 Transcript_70903/m.208059 type:complete len:247 (-) Transcript_70903:54-794(-)
MNSEWDMLMQTTAESAQLAPLLQVLPRAESMECTNDPRFMSDSVISKRLVAFKTICVVAIILLKLAKEQMLKSEEKMDITGHWTGPLQFLNFSIMTVIFVLMLAVTSVLLQQIFLTYRLLTAGHAGFEISKGFYLNGNIIHLRHGVVKLFFFGIPLFAIGAACRVMVVFSKASSQEDTTAWKRNELAALPCCAIMLMAAIIMWFMIRMHTQVFIQSYNLAAGHQQPLLRYVDSFGSPRAGGGLLDV